MKTVRMKIDVQSPNSKTIGRIDVKRVDVTTEADIGKDRALALLLVGSAMCFVGRWL